MTGRRAEDLPGESWIGLFNQEKRRDDNVYLQWNDVEDGPNARTVITPDGWKLAVYDRDHSMLFNRDRDPLEMSNLCYRPEHEKTVRRLRADIQKWQRSVQDRLPLPDRSL